MAIVGSAHVVIRALTDKLQSDIQAGLNKSIAASQSSGSSAGQAFSNAFNGNAKIGIPSSFNTNVNNQAKRAGAIGGAAVGAGVASGMAVGAAKGSQAVVAAAGRAGGSAGNIFGKMFNSSGGGGSRVFISMALRIAALLPLLGALVGGISSIVSGLFAMGAAANNAFYALSPLPGLIGALVQGGAVLMTAFGGVGTALSAGLKSANTPAKDAAAAMDGLGTAARDAAEAVRDAAEAVRDAREGISDAAEGIRDAKEALSDAARELRDAEKAAAEAIISANEAVADAKKNRREVHEDAAEAEAEAIERVQDAEKDLADSHKNVQKAQEALTDARKAAEERLIDLQFATRGGAIAEQRAIMALQDAQYKLNATSELPADNRLRQEAILAYEEAQLNLEMTKERNGDTAESLQEIRETGVDGTDEVVSAQERLVEAQENVADAAESVNDALKDQRDMHEGIAEAVRNANEAVKEAKQALRDAYKDAPEMVSDAREAVRDAKEALSDSREAFSDAQEALSDALTALGDAKKNMGQANAEFAAGIPAVNAYQEAMDKLSPPARRFVEFLISIRDEMAQLRTAAAAGLFPGLQTAIENLVFGPLFPALEKMMFSTGQSIANAAISISESLTTGVFVGNFSDVVEGNNRTIERMGLVIGDLVATLFAFMDAAQPVTDMFTKWLVSWADGLRVSTELGNANGTLTEKLLAGADVMKQLIRITKNLWEGFGDLGAIAETSGQSLLDSFEKATERFAAFTDNREKRQQLKEDFENIADNVREISTLALALGGAFFRLGADPAIGNIAKKLQPVVKTLEDLVTGLLDRVGDDLVLLLDQILIAFDEISKSGAIEVFLQTMSTAVGALIKAFQTPILGDALRLLVKIGAAMYALSILTKFPGISLLVKILPTLATLIGRVLLAMGPIGWIITAIGLLAIGFKILYERSETFRNIIDSVMGAVKVAIGITGRAFEWFGGLVSGMFDIIVKGAQWLWDVLFGHSIFPDIQKGFEAFFGAVGDIFTGIATFFTETLPNAAQALFNWFTNNWTTIIAIIGGPIGLAVALVVENWETIKTAFIAAKDWVFSVFGTAWDFIKDKIIEPIRGAKEKIDTIWTNIKTGFGIIKDWVMNVWSAVWDKIKDKIGGPITDAKEKIDTVWTNIKTGFTVVKDWVINTWSAVWDKIKDKIGGPIKDAKDNIDTVWTNIKTGFTVVKDWVTDTWSLVWGKIKDTIIKPVEDAKDAIVRFFNFDGEGGPIKKAFNAAVTGIKSIWDGIQKIAADPVNFVIGTVYNNGLRKALNLLPGVNLEEASKIEFASGGVLPGWSPGRDIHNFWSPTGGRLALSGGEAIMRPEFTAAVGGEGGVNRLNKLAQRGALQHFATGGVVWPVKNAYVNRTPYNLGHDGMDINHINDSGPDGQGGVVPFYAAAPGIVSYVGAGRGYGEAIFVRHPFGEIVYGHSYPGSARVSARQEVAAGQMLAMIGNTGNSSAPHLHWGFPGGTFYQAEALLNGAGMPAGGGGSGNAGQEEKDSWLDRIKNMKEALQNVVTGINGMGGRGGYYPLMGQAAKGVAGNAVQWANDKIPNSISIPGPNIPLPDNPLKLPFDQGGIAQGDENVWLPKRTARPERVLSPDQTVAFERLVDWLDRNNGSGGRGGDINLDVHVPQDASAREVVESIVYEMRRLQAGGKYIG